LFPPLLHMYHCIPVFLFRPLLHMYHSIPVFLVPPLLHMYHCIPVLYIIIFPINTAAAAECPKFPEQKINYLALSIYSQFSYYFREITD